jgi:hypothetical protein
VLLSSKITISLADSTPIGCPIPSRIPGRIALRYLDTVMMFLLHSNWSGTGDFDPLKRSLW